MTGEETYLKSCCRSSSPPRDDRSFSDSSADDSATTRRFRLGGVRAEDFSFVVRATYRGSCLAFVLRSRATVSSSVADSSPPRSELSSTLCTRWGSHPLQPRSTPFRHPQPRCTPGNEGLAAYLQPPTPKQSTSVRTRHKISTSLHRGASMPAQWTSPTHR